MLFREFQIWYHTFSSQTTIDLRVKKTTLNKRDELRSTVQNNAYDPQRFPETVFTKRLRRTQFVLLSLRTQANVDTLKINFSNIYIRYLRYLKSMQLDHG